jgi:hypothetical protein
VCCAEVAVRRVERVLIVGVSVVEADRLPGHAPDIVV